MQNLINVNPPPTLLTSEIIYPDSKFSKLILQVEKAIEEKDLVYQKNLNQQQAAVALSKLANDKYIPEILEEIDTLRMELNSIRQQKNSITKKLNENKEQFAQEDFERLTFDAGSEHEIAVADWKLKAAQKETFNLRKQYLDFEKIQNEKTKSISDLYKLMGIDNSKTNGITILNDNSTNKNPFQATAKRQTGFIEIVPKDDDFIEDFINVAE
jgi:hypothetical protein